MDVLVRNASQIVAKNATLASTNGLVGTVTGGAGALTDVVGTFAAKHQEGIEALCIVVGMIVAFCGRVILRPVVFLLGFVPTFGLFSSIGLSLITDAKPHHFSRYEAVVLCAALLLAVLVGLVTLKMLFRVAVFGICAIMGVFLVLILSLYFPPPVSDRAELIRDSAAGVAAICTGFLSMYWCETSAVFGTAIDGSAVAVYALARFLGNRPQLFAVDDTTVTHHWWNVFYASFTLGLAFFAALIQLRLSRAEHASSVNIPNGYKPIADLETGAGGIATPNRHEAHAENELELPKAIEDEDGFGGGYGATDHQEYSVAENMGAPPLSSHILGNTEPEQTTPRMTRLKGGSPFNNPNRMT